MWHIAGAWGGRQGCTSFVVERAERKLLPKEFSYRQKYKASEWNYFCEEVSEEAGREEEKSST